MKLLVVAGWTYPDEEGGSFRVVYETARRLAARGHDVHVATQRLKPEHPETEELAGITLHRYPTAAKGGIRFYLSTYREVRRLIDRLQPEVGFDAMLHHHPVSAFAANHARSVAALPRVAMLHMLYFLEHIDRHTYDPATGAERPLSLGRHPAIAALRWLDRWNLRRSNRVVVLSDFTRLLVERHIPEALGKVVTLPGGTDLDTFNAALSREEARERLGLPLGLPIFFTCRRLEHRMGIVELVDAAQRLCAGGRRFRLLIAGRGALEEALRQRIGDAGIGDTVSLLGYVPERELPLYYRAADCFVLPTRALEGFGLVTAEAFACGTPVLGTPVGATPELIEPFDPRLVTRDATADGIMEGMARFLDEVAAEPGLSARCRAYAERAFSWDPMIDGLERILRELVEGPTQG